MTGKIKDITITEFVNTKYREYWNHTNQSTNAYFPEEQLVLVGRHLMWAAKNIGLRSNVELKVPNLTGEILKTHVSGDMSVHDSIKLMSTEYRRQPAVRIMRPIGNVSAYPGDPGAHGRYLSVQGTPLLDRIIDDMKYMPTSRDEEGTEMVDWVSCPLPMMLINGVVQVGDGRSCYLPERDAREVIDWLEDNSKPVPAPMSSLGCKTYINPKNGYIVYEAVIEKQGQYDVIKNLIPGTSVKTAIAKLEEKLPSPANKRVKDNTGNGKYEILVPHGYLEKDKLTKYGLLIGKQEKNYIWDRELNTMRRTTFEDVALTWLEARQKIVKLRLEDQYKQLENKIHRIDLIKTYVDKGMSNWKSEDIEKELGKEDATIVLSSSARMFLPENLVKNEATKKEHLKAQKELKKELKDLKGFVIREARDIIQKQEDFFNYYNE